MLEKLRGDTLRRRDGRIGIALIVVAALWLSVMFALHGLARFAPALTGRMLAGLGYPPGEDSVSLLFFHSFFIACLLCFLLWLMLEAICGRRRRTYPAAAE